MFDFYVWKQEPFWWLSWNDAYLGKYTSIWPGFHNSYCSNLQIVLWKRLTLFRLGGHIVPPLFLLLLWSSDHQTWHKGILEQNLSKSVMSLMTSSPWGRYDVIKQFSVLFQVKIWASLLSNLAEIWHRGQFWDADFDVELKKAIGITLREEKATFHRKLKNLPKCSVTKVLPWQTP